MDQTEQEVLDNAAQPFTFRPDPAQGAAIASAVPRRAESQVDFGLYDRKRGAELVQSSAVNSS